MSSPQANTAASSEDVCEPSSLYSAISEYSGDITGNDDDHDITTKRDDVTAYRDDITPHRHDVTAHRDVARWVSLDDALLMSDPDPSQGYWNNPYDNETIFHHSQSTDSETGVEGRRDHVSILVSVNQSGKSFTFSVTVKYTILSIANQCYCQMHFGRSASIPVADSSINYCWFMSVPESEAGGYQSAPATQYLSAIDTGYLSAPDTGYLSAPDTGYLSAPEATYNEFQKMKHRSQSRARSRSRTRDLMYYKERSRSISRTRSGEIFEYSE